MSLLHEIDVHVLLPNDKQDCQRVIAETRAEAVEQVRDQYPEGSMFMALFSAGITDLSSQ